MSSYPEAKAQCVEAGRRYQAATLHVYTIKTNPTAYTADTLLRAMHEATAAKKAYDIARAAVRQAAVGA